MNEFAYGVCRASKHVSCHIVYKKNDEIHKTCSTSSRGRGIQMITFHFAYSFSERDVDGLIAES